VRLAASCPSCGQELLSSARFCQHCGTPIGAVAASNEPPPAPVEAPVATPIASGILASNVEVAPGPVTLASGPEFAAAPGAAGPMPIDGPALSVAPSSAGFSIERALNRMLRAVRLERGVFEEVQFDPAAMNDAITSVLIVGLAIGIGQVIATPAGGLGVLLIQLVSQFVGWFLWSYLVYFIGVKAFGGRGTANQMLRTMGLAYAPGALGFFLFIPVLGPLLLIAAWVWDMVVGVVAIRTTLDFDTGKAIATVVLAFVATALTVLVVISLFLAAVSAAR
jgi:hypothetical protein